MPSTSQISFKGSNSSNLTLGPFGLVLIVTVVQSSTSSYVGHKSTPFEEALLTRHETV